MNLGHACCLTPKVNDYVLTEKKFGFNFEGTNLYTFKPNKVSFNTS